MMRRILLLMVSLVIVGCASHSSTTTKKVRAPLPQYSSAEECTSANGKWFTTRSGANICDVPTSDAGKACRDSAECEALCAASTDLARGARVIGHCTKSHYAALSCVNEVRSGRALGGLCVD
jgi:uncharacterized protein YceK